MGSLFSCCFASRKDEDAVDERERLLTDPTEVPADRTSLQGDDPAAYQQRFGGDVRDYGTMGNGSKQETSAWNRTLEKMASDVIDVSTIEASSNTLEQSEWMERSRMYAHKVATSRVGSILKSTTRGKSLPKNDIRSAMDQAFVPIPNDDLTLIQELSEAAVLAVRNGFVVRSDEQLIVQFDP